MTTDVLSIDDLARRAVGADGLAEALRAIVALRAELDRLEAGHVDAALAQGWSWAAVGGALGVSRQAAHRRHARRHSAGSPPGAGPQPRMLVTSEARRAVSLAGRAAHGFGHRCVRADHLLLGLLEAGGPSAQALRSAGVRMAAARAAAAGTPDPPHDGPGVTSETRALLKEALRQAVARRDGWVGEEHLLLALLAGDQAGVVRDAGAEPGEVHVRLEEVLRSATRLGAAVHVEPAGDGACP